jgi:hypothetical protein
VSTPDHTSGHQDPQVKSTKLAGFGSISRTNHLGGVLASALLGSRA